LAYTDNSKTSLIFPRLLQLLSTIHLSFFPHCTTLNELTQKETPWIWEEHHQKSVEELRNRVTSKPVLAQPQLDRQFEIEVDTSSFGFGAVLTQKGKDGKKHPVAFYSATANKAECNYNIYDLELLAVIKACRHW
jgi:hypothetical protein